MSIVPRAPTTPADLAFLASGGKLGELIRAKDWSATSLGHPRTWPQSTRAAVSLCLNSRFPILLWLGPELCIVYNDAYVPFLGDVKHPGVLGAPGREAWGEIWHAIGPMLDEALAGRATWVEDFQFFFARRLLREEVYVTFSYGPIPSATGEAAEGVFCACTETTGRVVGERRLATLRGLGVRTLQQHTTEMACRNAIEVLEANPYDLTFAAIYLPEADGRSARRIAETRLPANGALAFPLLCPLSSEQAAQPWPFGEAARTGKAIEIPGLSDQVGRFATPLWPDLVETAIVTPLASPGQAAPAGFLVAGISPRRVLDADYRSFLELTAEHIAAAIAEARAFEGERQRAESLAELDRAKTAFFSNVSHEFRTSLALMLGPLEELLDGPAAGLSADRRELATLAHRNGLRLLRLVNILLDFSRIEAGRARASYVATDLARLTAEVASNFESACDRAGLSLDIACPALSQPVHVDRDMWEKIVLNLVSNAFKFTFTGGIRVSMAETPDGVELRVADTGVGISPTQLPLVFERFHRIEGQRSRSHEGSGIGLALVQELVRLHGGRITVQSEVGKGTTFSVMISFGTAHLPADRVDAPGTLTPTATGAAAYLEEARRWLPPEAGALGSVLRRRDIIDPDRSLLPGARILLADDNADMREYLTRLLSALDWDVESVADGAGALEAARRRPPDLVLSDVMMPGLSGLRLAAALRREPGLASLPVILLSARAGDEARVEGLESGADDYLVKPFASRELVARVKTQLTLARMRRDAAEQVRRSEARLQAAINLVGIALYAWDPVTNALDWDDRLRAMWGLPPGATVDLDTFFAAVHTDDRPRVEAAIAACVDPGGDGVYAIEYRVIGINDGVERWISTFGRTFFEADRPVALIGAALDATERKQAEERLHALQAELASELAAISRLHDLSMRLTARSSLSELLDEALSSVMELQGADFGNVQLVNEQTGALEIVAQHGLNQAFLEYFRTVSVDDTSCSGLALREGGRILIEDVATDPSYAAHRDIAGATGYRAVQSTCLVEPAGGKVLGMLSTLFKQPHRPSERELRLTDLYCVQAADVVAAKLAQERLRASEERLRQFADHSADVLRIFDAATRRIEYLSPAYERLWGAAVGTIREHPDHWVETIHPADRALALETLNRVLQGEIVVHEYRIIRPDTSLRWVRDTLFPIFDEHGQVRRVGGIAKDITKHSDMQVYVVDGEETTRQDLAFLLQRTGYEVKIFGSVRSFLDVAAVLVPGCVVLGIRAPEGTELTVPRELKARGIPLPVIVVGGRPGDAAAAVDAMKAGAVDWLDSSWKDEALLATVAEALARVQETTKADLEAQVARARIAGMSSRERDVLTSLMAGETNKEIARRLGISPRTVEIYRAHVMEKLGVRTLSEAVLLAAAAGLPAGPGVGSSFNPG